MITWGSLKVWRHWNARQAQSSSDQSNGLAEEMLERWEQGENDRIWSRWVTESR